MQVSKSKDIYEQLEHVTGNYKDATDALSEIAIRYT